MTKPEYLLPELLAPLVRNTIFSGNIHHCVQADSTNSIALRGAALASTLMTLRKERFFWPKNRPPAADAATIHGTPSVGPAFIVHFYCGLP